MSLREDFFLCTGGGLDFYVLMKRGGSIFFFKTLTKFSPGCIK